MAFTNDDKYLVTCGLTAPSACVIYDWSSGEVKISTAIQSATQEIFVLPEIVDSKEVLKTGIEEYPDEIRMQDDFPKDGVVVISQHKIDIFTVRNKSFS